MDPAARDSEVTPEWSRSAVMVVVLPFALLLAWRPKHLIRSAGMLLLLCFPAFLVAVVVAL
jgi:hypothetical protein